MAKVRHPEREGLHIRVVLGHGVAMGPGRAELLEGIAAHGSISAAGRAMGMSYRRAWLLVEETNQAFETPVVDAAPGGATGGGAKLTPLGEEVLRRYRGIEQRASQAASDEIAALSRLTRRSGGR